MPTNDREQLDKQLVQALEEALRNIVAASEVFANGTTTLEIVKEDVAHIRRILIDGNGQKPLMIRVEILEHDNDQWDIDRKAIGIELDVLNAWKVEQSGGIKMLILAASAVIGIIGLIGGIIAIWSLWWKPAD